MGNGQFYLYRMYQVTLFQSLHLSICRDLVRVSVNNACVQSLKEAGFGAKMDGRFPTCHYQLLRIWFPCKYCSI
jgi:hypothetical protein